MADFTYIRDKIIIDPVLKARIDGIGRQQFPVGSTIRLVAQQIQHAAGFTLEISGYHLIIVAGEYDNNGGRINVSGQGGGTGATGVRGAKGATATSTTGGQPGGPGGAGGSGGAGTAGKSVRIICELL